jgi:hypothetical protein
MTGESAMLARLVGQLNRSGGDLVTIRALVEEASEQGAERALTRLGLSDAEARKDLDELRDLLSAWRDAKRSAVRAAIDWIARGLAVLLLLGMAVRFGAIGWFER